MIQFKKQPCEYDPNRDLLDEGLIATAIWECLKENDPAGVIEVVDAHINAKKQSQLFKRHDLFKIALKSKNPTIRTLAKFVHENV